MAKVLEGPGMELLKKWGIAVPRFVVINSIEQFQHLAKANGWLKEESLVVKAHEAIGSRMKLGLVKLGLKYDAAEKAAREMLGKDLGDLKMRPRRRPGKCSVRTWAV
jgi:ATP-citrate lyase beta-subunit